LKALELEQAKSWLDIPGEKPKKGFAENLRLVERVWSDFESDFGKMCWVDDGKGGVKKQRTKVEHPFLKKVFIGTWPEKYSEEMLELIRARMGARRRK